MFELRANFESRLSKFFFGVEFFRLCDVFFWIFRTTNIMYITGARTYTINMYVTPFVQANLPPRP